MSQKVRCEQCGGEDFRLESGFYFCSECQLQSQDIQEHVLDAYYGGTAISSRKIKKTEDAQKSHAQQGPSRGNITSVEVLNYALKGLVDELILLGAPKKLKTITLQLWASYLRKIEIAFTSTTVQKKPKVGMWYRQGDVARFYKVRKSVAIKDYPRLVNKKRKEMSKKSSVGTSSNESRTARSKKLRLTISKTSLARAEYDESQVEGSFNLSQARSLASLDGSQASLISGGERIVYSKKGKKDIRCFLEQINKKKDKMKFYRRTTTYHANTLHNPRLTQLVAILRIALILSGSDIHPGDLLRWSEEGYFSYGCANKFIPPEITLTRDQYVLFQNPCFLVSRLFINTSHMVKFLGVAHVGISPSEIISNLVRRYCKILNLPDHVSTGIDKLLKLKPPKVWLDSTTSNFEGRAMALIIFSLKILIGLDDVTEYTYVPRKDVEGVKWAEWCSQYEARMAKKAVHHYPTLVRHYLNSYVGRNHSFLSHWDRVPAPRHGVVRNNSKVDLAMMDSFKRVLKPLTCKLPEPSWRPGREHEVKSSGPPLAVLSECIDGSVRKGERNIILEPPQKKERIKVKPKNALDLKVRVLNDDAEVKVKSAQLIDKPSSAGVKKVTGNEDYSVWMYHRDIKTTAGQIKFARVAASKMPHSFCWFLRQTAEIVHQTPLMVYGELVKVERVFSKTYYGGMW